MRKLKGFTLVEILIVIVIIGILIGALVPRMQSAQGRARDVARKNDLSQLQAAIVTSYQDKGNWPGVGVGATDGIDISSIEREILAAGMNGVPKDPLQSSSFVGIGDSEGGEGQYRYIVIKSYGSENGGFVLMAKTEVEGGSNWVVCTEAGGDNECSGIDEPGECIDNGCTFTADGRCVKSNGFITSENDVSGIKPCTSLTKVPSNNDVCSINVGGACEYANESQLRYILIN